MSHFASLGAGASVREALGLHPAASRHLLDLHEVVLRGESGFTEGERELIAAFVSALNACTYCHGVHAATAEAFGVDPGLLAQLTGDEEALAAPPKLRPVFRFVRKLTLTPSRMSPEDARAVFEEGWSERDLHDAICVAALFNFMNRYVEGHGLALDDATLRSRGEIVRRNGYAALHAYLPPA